MTLSISNYSRYSIDERLTIDNVNAKQVPLGPFTRELDRRAKDCVTKTNHCIPQSSLAKPLNRRSIFPSYRKSDPRLSRPSHSPSSTRCNTYTYIYDRDPYHFFGIEDDGSKTSSTDSDSLNSYESVLHKNEVGVIKDDCRRSRTCPSLIRAGAGMDGIVLNSMGKTTQSDTILFAKTRSCLRKSRFSLDTGNNNGIQPSKVQIKGKSQTSVSFESIVKVHLFQPPVENWAQNGWSNWFGNWH